MYFPLGNVQLEHDTTIMEMHRDIYQEEQERIVSLNGETFHDARYRLHIAIELFKIELWLVYLNSKLPSTLERVLSLWN